MVVRSKNNGYEGLQRDGNEQEAFENTGVGSQGSRCSVMVKKEKNRRQ